MFFSGILFLIIICLQFTIFLLPINKKEEISKEDFCIFFIITVIGGICVYCILQELIIPYSIHTVWNLFIGILNYEILNRKKQLKISQEKLLIISSFVLAFIWFLKLVYFTIDCFKDRTTYFFL